MTHGTDQQADDDAETDRRERHDEHLDGVEPGAGCTEIWEHLSEQRDEE
ncbi:hypothetical protein [Haloarchaeobius sp. HRN-SO-5]